MKMIRDYISTDPINQNLNYKIKVYKEFCLVSTTMGTFYFFGIGTLLPRIENCGPSQKGVWKWQNSRSNKQDDSVSHQMWGNN